MRRVVGGGFLLMLALGASACGKEQAQQGGGDTNGHQKIAPMPEAEMTRAKKACDAYVARVCACAQTHADMAEQCELAKASPSALQINLDLLSSSGLEIVEQKAVKVEARKIAAACFESDAKLDSAKCPRATP